jgi:hypothetical protein
MARKKATGGQVLEAITPAQQTFIEALLAGKSIKQAAMLAGVSRRTATYWLSETDHPVALEYEKQRAYRRQELSNRVANIYELAFKAIEDALSPEAPPGIRWQAAKLIYEKHLEQLCQIRPAPEPLTLVKEVAEQAGDQTWFETWEKHKLLSLPD